MGDFFTICKGGITGEDRGEEEWVGMILGEWRGGGDENCWGLPGESEPRGVVGGLLMSALGGVATTESGGEEDVEMGIEGRLSPSSSVRGGGEMRPGTDWRGDCGKKMGGGVWWLKESELVREGVGDECVVLGLCDFVVETEDRFAMTGRLSLL